MSDAGIEPTYIGKNENLTFIVPKELFNMSLGPAEVLDRESAKLFSKYLRGTFKGFNLARKTKYGNENNNKTETTPEFWEDFEKRAKEYNIDLIAYIPVLENYIFNKFISNKIRVFSYDKNMRKAAKEMGMDII